MYATSKEKPDIASPSRPEGDEAAKKRKATATTPTKEDVPKVEKAHSLDKALSQWSSTTKAEEEQKKKKEEDVSESSSHSPSPAKKRRVACKYGKECYQKSRAHKDAYWHPNEEEEDGDGQAPAPATTRRSSSNAKLKKQASVSRISPLRLLHIHYEPEAKLSICICFLSSRDRRPLMWTQANSCLLGFVPTSLQM